VSPIGIRTLINCVAVALSALTLAACVDSADPILTDSQAVLGPRLKLQLYSLHKGYAHDPEQATFTWNGALYVHGSGGMRDVSAFSVQPFEGGDSIIQDVPAKRPRISEYALLHKLADGVYQVIAIDEDDADEQTRAAYCRHAEGSPCRIETRDQLFAFARATAARHKDDGGLAIRLPDAAERTPRANRRKPRD
jgi:hypothetical protein